MDAMLTTIDNPYDPFEDFDKWFIEDSIRGHNTCGLIDRIAKTSDSFGESRNARIMEAAYDEIIKNDLEKKYKKVYRKESKKS